MSLVEQLQEQCELGQQELMRTNYLEAERILAAAEKVAWENREFDTLSRLYMPLQEARRQRRQRCGEGMVCLDLVAKGPGDRLDPIQIVERFPFGQLLVAGWMSIEPALEVRRIAWERRLYVETFLGTVEDGKVVIVPEPQVPASEASSDPLVLRHGEIPTGCRQGDPQTYAEVMDLWERLHAPFLAAADRQTDPIRKIEGYRRTIEVDYACELAHQKLSDVARRLQ